jgi:predicted dehydrogenase
MQRRDFLHASGAGLALAVGGYYVAAAEPKPLRAGLIGCGWWGKCDLFRLIQVQDVEVVSLCDVDQKMLAEAADMTGQRQKSKKKPRTYNDYRKMLAEKDLDVVLVDTPDHWHALPVIAACEAGADVWVQKPISVDVLEGKAMLDAARKHNRVVQVGMQRRSTAHLAEARQKVVKAGLLGKVGLVEICCYYNVRNGETPPVTKAPDFFDYEMWTGPAPLRPYDPPEYKDEKANLPHRRWWRAFMEYGNGIIGDMGVHMFDIARWQLDLGWPRRISSTGGIFVQKKARSNISDTQTATFAYDDFDVVWQHRTWGESPDRDYPWATIIYGEKGTLKLNASKYEFFPLGQRQPSLSGKVIITDKYPEDRTERDLDRSVADAIREHMRDFVSAIGSRGKPIADIEQGHISTACCILANVSMQVGRTLAFDPETHQCKDDAEANKLLKRAYRNPWSHPAG